MGETGKGVEPQRHGGTEEEKAAAELGRGWIFGRKKAQKIRGECGLKGARRRAGLLVGTDDAGRLGEAPRIWQWAESG